MINAPFYPLNFSDRTAPPYLGAAVAGVGARVGTGRGVAGGGQVTLLLYRGLAVKHSCYIAVWRHNTFVTLGEPDITRLLHSGLVMKQTCYIGKIRYNTFVTLGMLGETFLLHWGKVI